MDTALHFKYGWEAIKPSHPKKPHYLFQAEDARDKALEMVDALCEQLESMTTTPEPAFYATLQEAQDTYDRLEKYRLRLSRYFHETGEWELPIPSDRKSEKKLAELRMGVRL